MESQQIWIFFSISYKFAFNAGTYNWKMLHSTLLIQITSQEFTSHVHCTYLTVFTNILFCFYLCLTFLSSSLSYSTHVLLTLQLFHTCDNTVPVDCSGGWLQCNSAVHVSVCVIFPQVALLRRMASFVQVMSCSMWMVQMSQFCPELRLGVSWSVYQMDLLLLLSDTDWTNDPSFSRSICQSLWDQSAGNCLNCSM
jgi:hypothetical protein